jgi:hypothetical protein
VRLLNAARLKGVVLYLYLNLGFAFVRLRRGRSSMAGSPPAREVRAIAAATFRRSFTVSGTGLMLELISEQPA